MHLSWRLGRTHLTASAMYSGKAFSRHAVEVYEQTAISPPDPHSSEAWLWREWPGWMWTNIQAYTHMLIIPILRRLRQRDHRSEARLGYKVRSFLKLTNQPTIQNQNCQHPHNNKNAVFIWLLHCLPRNLLVSAHINLRTNLCRSIISELLN